MTAAVAAIVALGVLAAAMVSSAPAGAQGWFDRSPPPPPPAQSAPAEIAELSLRVDRLEELVRRLNGEIEEMRYRLQGGDGRGQSLSAPVVEPLGRAAALPGPTSVVPEPVAVAPLPGSAAQPMVPVQPFAGAQPATTGGPTSLLPPSPYLPEGAEALGTPPQPLGTVPESALRGRQESFANQTSPVAPIEEAAATGGPEATYKNAYGYLLQQDFGAAEYSFAQFLNDYPDHQLAGNAQYWFAETFYARSQYRRAAQEFLEGYQTYPSGPKAPDSLLKLGMTLAALGQNDQACVSLAEVATKFPRADQAVRERAVAEHQRAGC